MRFSRTKEKMKNKISPKRKIKNSNIATYFSAFLEHSDSIAILLDNNFKVIDFNAAAKKYYKICKLDALEKEFSFLEKNNAILKKLDKIKQKPGVARLTTQPNKNNNNDLPIAWLFLNLERLCKISGYLVIGNTLLPTQYLKIQNEKIENYLKEITDCMPGNFYWKDKNGRYLGCNQTTLTIPGYGSEEELIGKTDYDIWPEQAEELRKNDSVVMATGKPTYFEETVQIKGKKPKFFAVVKIPLKDANGNIIGIIGNSLDITYRKEKERLYVETELQKVKLKEQENFRKIVDQAAYDTQSPLAILLILVQHCTNLTKKEVFETLKKLADITPTNLYWFDENNAIMGANQHNIKSIGGEFITDFIGKTPYDYFPFEMAENAVKHNNLVMQTGKILSKEEMTKDLTTGETKYFIVFKAPLYDNNGKSIGLLCTAVDITAEKNAERLKLENELQKARLDEQENFHKVADQVVHDIRSPLASLLMIVKSCEEKLGERERVSLREAATSIGDIANNLLSKYNKDDSTNSVTEVRQPVILSLALLQLLSEKKHQYKELPIEFTHNFCADCNFTFIKADPIAFRRMMSNLINNAVDALDGKEGKVDLKLNMDNKLIKITIQDNGKGMSQQVIDKIINNIAVTLDKKEGHGIGFVQISETLKRNQGKLEINSEISKGTEITIAFPIIATPEWVAKEIKLNQGDTVIILDDDDSIHGAWDTCFKKYKKYVHLKHFTLGQEAINFINNFSEKEKIFLLSDFELLKQELNGLHVIEKTHAKRSILVTSHYTNLVVRNLAIKSGTKILPKMLASEVPIEIVSVNSSGKCIADCSNEVISSKRGQRAAMKSDKCTIEKDENKKFKKVDLVLIDDDKMLVDALSAFFESQGKIVDKYYNPIKFLDNISQYAKDVKIFMDNDFKSSISGIELAKQLHENDYISLYLFSGKDFVDGDVPDYLTVISKTDTDNLLSFVG